MQNEICKAYHKNNIAYSVLSSMFVLSIYTVSDTFSLCFLGVFFKSSKKEKRKKQQTKNKQNKKVQQTRVLALLNWR